MDTVFALAYNCNDRNANPASLCVVFPELVGSILPPTAPSMLPILWSLGGGQMQHLLGHRKLDFHYVLL